MGTLSPNSHLYEQAASPLAKGNFWLRVAWNLLFLLLVGSFVATLPVLYRNISSLSPLNRPETTWTAQQVVVSLAALDLSRSFYVIYQLILRVSFLLIYFVVGGLIFLRKSADRGAVAIATVLIVFGWGSAGVANVYEEMYPAYQVVFRSLSLLSFSSLGFFFLIFPDGRFVPRWTGWLGALIVITAPLSALDSPVNPTRWPVPWGLIVTVLYLIVFIYAQVYRYRRVSTPDQRQQTKWVMYSLGVLIFGYIIPSGIFYASMPVIQQPGDLGMLFYLLNGLIGAMAYSLIPISIGIAVLRYRLWDIDPIVNRSLVFGALTIINLGIYLLITWMIGEVLLGISSSLFGFLAAGLIVVLFQPMRAWIQRLVNRVTYGLRDEPYEVISRLGQRLESTLAPHLVLPIIVQTVKDSFRLPFAAIALKQGDTYVVAASAGSPVNDPFQLPLVHQNEMVGQLLLAPRAAGERFHHTDWHLLKDLARQAGVAVYALQVTFDLQTTRERLVAMREEERRRLRRDLHDSLGPILATLSMKLDIVQDLVFEDPVGGAALLSDIHGQMKEAIAYVRQVVYALRPPVLDQFGLAGAIREHAHQELGSQGVKVSLDLPEPLPMLPAAVEVAAYYIAIEALTNVLRHSSAHTCQIRLVLNGVLTLEIVDDGRGVAVHHETGVGLHSMRERAAELGGTCQVEPAQPRGTRVMAYLPLTKG